MKAALEAAKPEGMQWNEFFEVLLQSTDTNRFYEVAEAKFAATEEEAIAKARERYESYRAGNTPGLSGTELRRKIHLRRLVKSLEAFRGSARLCATNPNGGANVALAAALADLDEQIHAVQPLLATE